MTDAEIARRLSYIHHTLELIALLLAAVALGQGPVGLVVGTGGVLLLVANVVARTLG